ncbi:MFS transporter [Novosphingobium percolationis]|uniref:MFS transporter n=1 Tax=Novosphingobium percolationis TaxID=2871811 RepID=UPI001CD6CE86|nr:MFS transporter [Novosphingobium percolationis]
MNAATAEWRKGWPSVALTALGLTCAPATLPVYTLGVLVAPLQGQFGWSRAAIQAAILFSTGLGLAGGPLAGWMVRSWGLRATVLSGLAGMALSLLACAGMTGWIWQLYAAYAMMSLLGAGANAVSWSTYVSSSFDRSRGLALGVALSGTGLSAVLMPRIASFGLGHGPWGDGSWRVAYLALATFVVVAALPLCALFVPKGANGYTSRALPAASVGMDVADVVRTARFWLVGLSSASIYMAVGGLIPNLVPALTDKGLSAAQAVQIMGVMGFAVIGGRIAVGVLVDRLWAPLVALLVLVPAAIGCLVLNTAQPASVYAICAAAIGLVTGMEFDMLAFLIGRYFGLRDYARIYGRLYMFLAVAAGGSPMLFGALFDRTGSYAIPAVLSAALFVAGAAMLLVLGKYPDLPATDKPGA